MLKHHSSRPAWGTCPFSILLVGALALGGFAVVAETSQGDSKSDSPRSYVLAPGETLSTLAGQEGGVALAAGDVNGDGTIDIVVGNALAGRPLLTYLNKGKGRFSDPIQSPRAGNFNSQSADLIDLNGDGKLDFVCGGSDVPSISFGRGDGTFAVPVSTKFPGGYAALPEIYSQVFADFNGDGKLDMAATGTDGFGVALNPGDGKFRGSADYKATHLRRLAVGDFNRDRQPDLVGVDGVKRVVRVFLNDAGSFSPDASKMSELLPGSARWERGEPHIAVGDFNGDGKPDVAVTGASFSEMSVDVLLGNGDGTLGAPTTHRVGTKAIWRLLAADVNKDGKSDLVVACTRAVVVLISKGDGTFETPLEIGASGQLSGVAVGDFSGSGALGFAAITPGSPSTIDVFTATLKRKQD